MKFAAGLIKIFSGMLSAVVFGAFLYYTYQYQITQEHTDLFIADIALAVFLISAVTFALLFILFDVYQNQNTESNLVKLLKGTDLGKNNENSNITDLLVKIASLNNQTNQLLDSRLNEINTGLNSLNNSSEVNNTNLQSSLEQLANICGEISKYVDNIKTEKSKDRQFAVSNSGNFDLLIATVSALSTDFKDMNGHLIDAVNRINHYIKSSIKDHTNIDNDIKDLLKEILSEKNSNSTNRNLPVVEQPTPEIAAPAQEESNKPAPQSIADFYEERFKAIDEEQAEKNEDAPAEVTEDSEVLQENEQRIDSLLSTPEQTETFAPQPQDLTVSQEDTQIEKQADAETESVEEKEPWNTALGEEISTAEQEYLPQQSTAADEPAVEESVIEEPVADEPVIAETVETPVDFDVNAAVSDSFEAPAKIESANISEPVTAVDEPHVEPYFEQPAETAVSEPTPVDDFSLAASDPFNPSPEHFADLEQAAKTDSTAGTSFDLQDEEPVSIDLPNEESNVKLDDIFNDDFASEIADLDILKDDVNNQNTGEISVEDLLADDKDPYNPNK